MAPPFDLPSGPALVRATLLMGALGATSTATAQEAPTPIEEIGPIEDIRMAPTCGPCCHGSPGCDEMYALPKPLVQVEEVGSVEVTDFGTAIVRGPVGPFIAGDQLVALNGQPIDTTQLANLIPSGTVTVLRNGEELAVFVSGEPEELAPTCGPCCHGSADCDDEFEPPPPVPLDKRSQRRERKAQRKAERGR